MMRDTLEKYGTPHIANIRSCITGGREYTEYGNGAAWGPSMMKLSAIAQLYNDCDVQDSDYVLSVDSDVLFTSSEIFEHIHTYGIIGILGQQPWNTINGPWAHMSGCLIFLRGDIVRKMIELSDEELNSIRFNEFKTCDITENEDVVLSYLAKKCGADAFDLSKTGLIGGDFESDFKITKDMCNNPICSCQPKTGIGWYCSAPHLIERHNHILKSFYHLNYCPTRFLGEQVLGKWDLPKVLKSKGIEL
jgi:hypothetical protein